MSCTCKSVDCTDYNTYNAECAGNTCTPVCYCYSVVDCYDDCSSYVAKNTDAPNIWNNVALGDLILGNHFKTLFDWAIQTADHYNINVNTSCNDCKAGNIIYAAHLNSISDVVITIANTDGVSPNGTVTNIPTVYSGDLIRASTLNTLATDIYKYLTGCRCNSDVYETCNTVCSCKCHYS